MQAPDLLTLPITGPDAGTGPRPRATLGLVRHALEVPLPAPPPPAGDAPRRADGPVDLRLGQPLPPRRTALLLGLAAVVLAADLVSKVVVVATLQDGSPVRLLGGLLTLTHARNPGAAFSIGTNATLLFSLVAIAVVVAVLRVVPQVRHTGWALALGLLLGGALGNLVDRVFRDPGPLRGAVVDWIRVPHWPTFNLADCGIVVGGLLAALLSVRGVGLDGTRHVDDHPVEGPGPPAAEPGTETGTGPHTEPGTGPHTEPGTGPHPQPGSGPDPRPERQG